MAVKFDGKKTGLFLASLLERSLIPAVPNKTPAAKSPVFFPSNFTAIKIDEISLLIKKYQ